MNILIIAVYELRRLTRSRWVLMTLFLLPLVLIFLLGASLSGVVGDKEAETIDPVKVAVVNAGGQEAPR